MSTISSLSHVTFFVDQNNLEKCKSFYTDIGFSILRVGEDCVKLAHYADDRAAPVCISLEVGDVGVSNLTFSVESLDPILEKCAEIKLNATTTDTKVTIKDPCGNVLCFSTTATPSYSLAAPLPKPKVHICMSPVEKAKEVNMDCCRVGILTSGGDSQGMNAAVRAVVRKAIVANMVPFGIRNGYQGLVDNLIQRMSWSSVNGILGSGGTMLGTARCKEFRTEVGRLRAAMNLVKNGIDALVVIGGDGSLTGADLLRSEWPKLLEKLVEAGDMSVEEQKRYSFLKIVGLVGSIDNDMCMTDMTIGCASALHRICEAIDAIGSTALSHSRAFVIEVMGRHCGWLAAMAAIAVGADYLFVPERPFLSLDWQTDMCYRLQAVRAAGKQKIIVIVSEGAIDRNLKPIRAEYVRELLEERLHFDARVTTLGHIQRGGAACFYDRFLATIQGVRAIDEILNATPETKSPMIGISNNQLTTVPLVEAVRHTKQVSAAIEDKNFLRAMDLRDPEFAPSFATFVAMSNMPDDYPMHGTGAPSVGKAKSEMCIGIIHIGAPAGGFNVATRAATLLAHTRGHTVVAFLDGFKGLMNGEYRQLSSENVSEWSGLGGSVLGTNRSDPSDLGLCAMQLQRLGVNALLLIGGFEAFLSLNTLYNARKNYPAFCIPMALIPTTISNNVPGTDYSLGSDTALNFIVNACDSIKQSASASRKRVFVIEVQGGNVGFLPTLGGLAGGASTVYIPEVDINLARISKDVNELVSRYKSEETQRKRYKELLKRDSTTCVPPPSSKGRVVLRSESVSSTYTTSVLCDILNEESEGYFDARTAVLGHMQQGGPPSPLDRIRATRLASLCVEWFESHATGRNSALPCDVVYTNDPESACVIGIRGSQVAFTNVKDLMDETDKSKRRATTSWWMPLYEMIPTLAVYPQSYKP